MTRVFASPAQRFAAVFGTIYLLVGVAGFAVTGVHDFAGPMHRTLVIFAITPLHNVVHCVLGAGWLAGAFSARGAVTANLVNGVVLGLVTIVGFVHAMGMLGMHDLGDPDNFLHLATAALALYFGSAGATRATPLAAQT